jgi:hypothetical protein
MDFNRLSFPSIPNEPSRPAHPSGPASGEPAFGELYSEAIQNANQEMARIASTDLAGCGEAEAAQDPIGFLELRSVASAFGSSTLDPGGDFSALHNELMQQLNAIRVREQGGSVRAPSGSPAAPSALQRIEGGLSSGVHRLISWLDSHAHLHSQHQCAASVRQAMEAAGMSTGDRPASGDAGDYGPFLLRHGAEVIPQASYEPKAGDIAVFDRTSDHPAGHIQVFDGQNWVSDFVQHTFSPYRDQASTPTVTIYRLS